LSLSPTGANPAGSVRIYPELIAMHIDQAHQLRARTMSDFTRLLWHALTRRSAKPPVNECDWLNPQAAG
jgi:hypothetical protein